MTANRIFNPSFPLPSSFSPSRCAYVDIYVIVFIYDRFELRIPLLINLARTTYNKHAGRLESEA